MSEPLPPEATSPPAPRRVQFTMRTFFVAAVWISAVFAIGKSLPGELAAVCITALVAAGFYGIYGILQATSAKIAMVLGTAVMLLGFVPLLVTQPHWPSDLFSVVASCSMAWGVVLSILTGTVRAFVLHTRRKKQRPWYGFWRQRVIGPDEEPRSEARTMAFALAGAHFRWSSYVLILGLLAQFILTHVFALPSNSPSPQATTAIRMAAAWLLLLDGPCLPSLILLLSHDERLSIGNSIAVAWLIFNLLGVPLYFVLGGLIGRFLDRTKNARALADPLLLSKPSSPASAQREETSLANGEDMGDLRPRLIPQDRRDTGDDVEGQQEP